MKHYFNIGCKPLKTHKGMPRTPPIVAAVVMMPVCYCGSLLNQRESLG
ncbi:MAG: hypothetical protein LUP94_03795 [Candidatus Methanomethylicus sp.]|nr:hypothetical protein [Candidatus Methanomethylicus sp.]